MQSLKWYSRNKGCLEEMILNEPKHNIHIAKDENGYYPPGIVDKKTGKPKFVVAKKYTSISLIDCLKMLKKDQNLYEIITKDKICKIYLDIDDKYRDLVKVGMDKQVIDLLINKLTEYLQKIYNQTIQKNDIIILDSSTRYKFSYHIIINSLHTQSTINTTQLDQLKTIIGDFKTQCNDNILQNKIDMEVYDKNQFMRCIKQSKVIEE